jgi:nitrate/nitrite transport system permease protein
MKINGSGNPWLISGFILAIFLGGMASTHTGSSFEAKGKTDEQLQMMMFNGDIVRTKAGDYVWNPEKMKGVPGPLAVLKKARTELSEAFVIKGTNDHGIAYLVLYRLKIRWDSSRRRYWRSSLASSWG